MIYNRFYRNNVLVFPLNYENNYGHIVIGRYEICDGHFVDMDYRNCDKNSSSDRKSLFFKKKRKFSVKIVKE